MFSPAPAHAFRFDAPIPPMPMPAMFSLLPGACAPSTRLGTMAADSAPRAVVAANCRREMIRLAVELMMMLSGQSYAACPVKSSGDLHQVQEDDHGRVADWGVVPGEREGTGRTIDSEDGDGIRSLVAAIQEPARRVE